MGQQRPRYSSQEKIYFCKNGSGRTLWHRRYEQVGVDVKLMSHDRIKVSGIIEIETVLSFEMRQAAGAHAYARLCGVLTDDGATKLSGQLERKTVLIYDIETGDEIFHGIIDEAELISESGYNVVQLSLLAGSWLLDIEKGSRSFQDINMTYDEVIKSVLYEYPSAASIVSKEMCGKKIGTPIIRYRETAWEFISRLASHFNLAVFSDVRTGHPRIYVGVPELYKEAEFSNIKYDFSIGEAYMASGGMLSGLSKKDFIRYDVEDGVNYRLGFDTGFMGMRLAICGKSCKLENDVYVFTYLLASRKYCYVRKRYNPFFLGMSLLGRVLHREGEHIRIKFDIDGHQDVNTCYPYPWKPETGNLMYLMPQIGSRVSVYFGDDDERSGIATVTVRDNAPRPPAKGDEAPPEEPDYVSENIESIVQDFNQGRRGLLTEHNKRFDLFPGGIRLASNRGLGMSMDATNGISLFSNGEISIIAENDIRVQGKTVSIEGKVNAYVGAGGLVEDGGGYTPESGMHLFSSPAAVELGAKGEPDGGIKYLARSRVEQDTVFNDEPHIRPLEASKIVGNALAATTVIVIIGASILTCGIAAPVAKIGLAATLKTIGTNVIITGCAYVVKQILADLGRGVVSKEGKYLEAALRGMLVGVIYGLMKIPVVKSKLKTTAREQGAIALGGAGEDVVNQLYYTGEVDFLQAALAGGFNVGVSWAASGATRGVTRRLSERINPKQGQGARNMASGAVGRGGNVGAIQTDADSIFIIGRELADSFAVTGVEKMAGTTINESFSLVRRKIEQG